MVEAVDKESKVFTFNSVVTADSKHKNPANKGKLSASFKTNSGRPILFDEDKLQKRIKAMEKNGIEPDESKKALKALRNRMGNR